jgi:hypothetical protein
MRSAQVLVPLLLGACNPELGAVPLNGAGEDAGPNVDLGDGDADADADADDPIDPDLDDPIVPPDDGPTDECGDIRVANVVYYGTAEPTVVPLSPGQMLAIGTFGGCSGTVIAPTWVLTASHCGLGGGEDFCVGEDSPDTCIGSIQAYDAPGDMTLLELDRDAREVLPELVPIPILTEDMDEAWIGRTAEASGYGGQEDGSSGEREFTAEPIVSLSGDTLTIDGEGRHGVCFGDSGGPVMVVASDGTARVAGDLSNGDGSCVGRDNFTRVDVYRDWIEDHTGPTVPPNGCGGVDGAGRCLDGVATWCDDDRVQSQRCEAGTACGWDAGARGFRCIAGVDPCGGVDGFGTCDGGTARWCDAGIPRARDCTACGQTCDPEAPIGGADCVDDPCRGLDYLGQCNGDVAEWCNREGAYESEDCGARGQSCQWIDDDTGYYCG